jgi:hypothetical protein
VRPILAATVVALTIAAALAVPAAASACAKTTPATVASALHLTDAEEVLVLYTPPPAWSDESFCLIDAWSGPRPSTSAQVQAGLAAGTYAVVQISGWSPATGLLTRAEYLQGFQKTLASVRREARTQLLTGLHGSTFKPALHGGQQAAGWRAASGSFRTARGLWWSRPSLRILTITLREGRKKPVAAILDRLAASAVPAFGL